MTTTVIRRPGRLAKPGVVPAGRSCDSPSSRSARAAQRINALGEMTGGVVHDLRNILCVIASALRVAEQRPDDPAALDVALEHARNGVDRGLRTISRLLAFAMHQQRDAAPEDVNALLRKLEAFLKYGAGSGVQLVLGLAPNLPECLVDPAQFNAAILNLVVNARDAMPNGGVIRISTEAAAHEALPGGGHHSVLVRIADNGAGMPPEVASRVFDPYFTTKGDQGTGLGVPQVHALMQRIGGRVEVDSKVGAGTTFSLFFPIGVEPPASAARMPAWQASSPSADSRMGTR